MSELHFCIKLFTLRDESKQCHVLLNKNRISFFLKMATKYVDYLL